MEEWRNVPGFNGKYQIDISTKEGRCRSLFNNQGRPRKEPHYLSNKPNVRDNYISWQLCKDGRKINHQAAKWIALTFPELVQNEYFEGACIDHIDGNRLNNHPSNLRWATYKENVNNPITIERMCQKTLSQAHKEKISQKNTNNPKTSQQVVQYSLSGKYIATFKSMAEAERQTGINKSSIYGCCVGKRSKAGHNGEKYIWKYKE
jgi:hypothetical protein